MYGIGDKTVYGALGVMTVVDIRDEVVSGARHKYYVLCESGSSSGSLTFVPTDNERLVNSMRPLLTREKLLKMLDSALPLDESEWQRDSRARAEKFKRIIESGDREKILSMIISIRNMGRIRASEGKKNFLADENLMNRAKRLICSELSEVLSITEAEAAALLKEKTEK